MTTKRAKHKKIDNLSLLPATEQLCQRYHIKPARSKGQNFLINAEIYQQIIDLAQLKAEDMVLEVGPGLGFLTIGLSSQAKQVTAIELDDKLARALQTRLASQGIKNVKIINQNVLDIREKQLPKDYQIIANLPYNITSVFLRKFLEFDNRPQSMILMLQQEVAERLTAQPGQMSLLAISIQFYSQPELAFKVKAENFWPQPKVDSAVVKIAIKPQSELPLTKASDIKLFFRLVKFGFSAKRKMLKNNLAGGLKLEPAIIQKILEEAKLNIQIRAQELSLNDWLKLFGKFKDFMI